MNYLDIIKQEFDRLAKPDWVITGDVVWVPTEDIRPDSINIGGFTFNLSPNPNFPEWNLFEWNRVIPIKHQVIDLDTHDPVNNWFELSYAHYLTVPRSVLQSMPQEWQQRFTKCLDELDETIDWRPDKGRYYVQLRDDQGRFVHDTLADYQRGRRFINHIKKED